MKATNRGLKTDRYANSQILELINEYIHSERDRLILSRRLIDGITYEKLAEEFELSSRHVRDIVHQGKLILFEKVR